MCWYTGPRREFLFFIFYFFIAQDLGNHEPVLTLCCSESDVWNHCSEHKRCACHCSSFVVVMTVILALSSVVSLEEVLESKRSRSSYLFITWCLEARNAIFGQKLTYFTYLLINLFRKYLVIITMHQTLYRRPSIGWPYR